LRDRDGPQRTASPTGSDGLEDDGTVGGGERFEIEVGGPAGEGGGAVGQHADELEAFGNDLAVAGLHFMREQKKERGLFTFVGRVNEDGALPEQIGVLFQ